MKKGASRARAISLIAALILGACDPRSPAVTTGPAEGGIASGSTAAAPASAPGPAPTSCRVAADCGAGRWCRFDDAGCGASVRGTCADPEPLCTVAHPFCACSGETVGACYRPSVPFARRGACDGGAPRAGR